MTNISRWWNGLGKELEVDLESQDGFNEDVSV
jgi:hypothetical protein